MRGAKDNPRSELLAQKGRLTPNKFLFLYFHIKTGKTEKEKMLAGELYNALDPQLLAERLRTQLLFQELNAAPADDVVGRSRLLRTLLPHAGTELGLNSPFYCDYGTNITMGDQVFLNFNCTILDVAAVTIGSRTLLGPGVQICTATHPLDYQ